MAGIDPLLRDMPSMLDSGYLTIVLIFVCTLLLILSSRRGYGIPPGPLLLPVIGNLFSLVTSDIREKLRSLRQRHGDIYSFYIGQQLTIVINGYDAIQRALIRKGGVFSNRPETRFSKIIGQRGIIFGAKTMWKQNRQIAQNGLKEFGFGKSAITVEYRIQREITELLQFMETRPASFDGEDIINKSLANVVCGIVYGNRFEIDDPAFIDLIQGVKDAAKNFATASVLYEGFPWMKYFPGDMLKLKWVDQFVARSDSFFSKTYDSHKKTFNANNISDFVDLYISEMEKGESDTFTRPQLQSIQSDMVAAGSETSASSIRWLLLYLLHYPEIQQKLHFSIDDVIGRERRPTLTDRPNLPYVEATICEILRIAPPAPFAVPHTVDKDTEFEGFLFPANTSILINLDSVLMDPNVWDEPTVLRPERFLDDEGQLKVPPEFVPFSIGRRSCIGESLARMELFLFVTSLLQRFEFQTPEGALPPKPVGVMGLTYSPVPYAMHVLKRN